MSASDPAVEEVERLEGVEKVEEVEEPRKGPALWPYLWLILLLIAMIPNGIMIWISSGANTAAVEARPYEASKAWDEEKASRLRFLEQGYQLDSRQLGGGRVRFELQGGPPLEDVRLHFMRPADADLDRVVPWPDPDQPLELSLPAPGLWHLELQARSADTAVSTRQVLGQV